MAMYSIFRTIYAKYHFTLFQLKKERAQVADFVESKVPKITAILILRIKTLRLWDWGKEKTLRLREAKQFV